MRVGQETDPATRVALLERVGKLWVEKFGDGVPAFDAYSRCLANDWTYQPAVAELERLASIEDRWADLVGLYQRGSNETVDVR